MASRRLVEIAAPPGDAFIAALEAAWSRGDAVLPLDPRLPPAVRQQLARDLGVGDEIEDDVALVIATSGSTGDPKGAMLTMAALEASARSTMARIGIEPGDRWLSCLPWHHIGGLQVLLRARLFGLPLVVQDTPDTSRATATLTSLVPTQLIRLLDAGADLTGLRAILLGGAPAPAALLARARAAGANVVPTYGMSETAGGCVYDGVPLDGVEVRIDPDGRILLRGPVLMSGYRGQPDLTAATLVDGWLRTEDLGLIDDDGRLVVRGRMDDVVITGGENVDASRVAEILATHPSVREAAVAGVEDREWGQRVVAVIVAHGSPPSLEELRAWVSEHASPAAAPRQLVVLAEIPKLASGKTDRVAILALASS